MIERKCFNLTGSLLTLTKVMFNQQENTIISTVPYDITISVSFGFYRAMLAQSAVMRQ